MKILHLEKSGLIHPNIRIDIWQKSKTIQWRKNRLFKKWSYGNWISKDKENEPQPTLTSHTKLSSMDHGLKRKTVKCKIVTLLENSNLGKTSSDSKPRQNHSA